MSSVLTTAVNCSVAGGSTAEPGGWKGTDRIPTTKERPVNGYCSICIRFPAGRRAEIRAESENTWRGSAGSEDHHTHCRATEKKQWELVRRIGLNKQSLRLPAPYYPIIYTAWELGNAGCWRRPLVFTEKWHSTPHANQQSWHYSLRQVWNSFRPNVFILNIQRKLLHQRQAMSEENSKPFHVCSSKTYV